MDSQPKRLNRPPSPDLIALELFSLDALASATRQVSTPPASTRVGWGQGSSQRAAALAALTSFEFFHTLVENSLGEQQAAAIVLKLAYALFPATT